MGSAPELFSVEWQMWPEVDLSVAVDGAVAYISRDVNPSRTRSLASIFREVGGEPV